MLDNKLKAFIDEKISQIELGPEVCFGIYYAPGLLPHDRRVPVKITPKEFGELTVYLTEVTIERKLGSAAIRFETFVKGSRAGIAALLAFNRRAVEEMMRETNRSGNATMLISSYVKDHFTDKGGFFMFTFDVLKK